MDNREKISGIDIDAKPEHKSVETNPILVNDTVKTRREVFAKTIGSASKGEAEKKAVTNDESMNDKAKEISMKVEGKAEETSTQGNESKVKDNISNVNKDEDLPRTKLRTRSLRSNDRLSRPVLAESSLKAEKKPKTKEILSSKL